jgi:hypothetical protein
LRVKYEKKAIVDAADAAEAAQRQRAAAGEAALAAAKAEEDRVDMRMDDPDVEAMRRDRIAQLKARAAAAKVHRADGHGDLREITEDEFLKEVTSSPYVVVHFYHDEFMKCKVMDKHLRLLAPQAACLQTKFIKINCA